jgi:hypothetical protein
MVRTHCHVPEDSDLTWLENFVTCLKTVTLILLHAFREPEKLLVSLRYFQEVSVGKLQFPVL